MGQDHHPSLIWGRYTPNLYRLGAWAERSGGEGPHHPSSCNLPCRLAGGSTTREPTGSTSCPLLGHSQMRRNAAERSRRGEREGRGSASHVWLSRLHDLGRKDGLSGLLVQPVWRLLERAEREAIGFCVVGGRGAPSERIEALSMAGVRAALGRAFPVRIVVSAAQAGPIATGVGAPATRSAGG